MKNKILTSFIAGIFALLLISLVSATISFSNVPTLSQTGDSFTITVTTNETEVIDFTASEILDSNGKKISFTPVLGVSFTNDTPQTITVNYTIESGFDFEFGETYTTTLTADGDVSPENATQTLNFEQTSFCEWDDNEADETTGDLQVKIRDISVVKGFGDDEEWFLLDEVEVEVRVKNKGDYDVDDIVVEWGLFNKKTGEWTIEVDDLKDFNLKDGDEKTLTFNFKLDDLDEDFDELQNGDFVLYVRATGEVDADTPYDACARDSKNTDIIIEDDFVVLDNIQLPEKVSCGDQVQLVADVWNIGDEDQEDVYVIIYNEELGINEKIIIGDIDAFENEELNALIKIPEDAEEKYYTLTFLVYDEYSEVYENRYNDDKAKFDVFTKVEGGCIFNPKLTIVGSLESGGKAGELLVVRATVTNTDSKTRTFDVNASGYDSWSELSEISEDSITLEGGKSKDVLFTFNVNKDASGNKEFSIDLVRDDEKLISQPVSVLIEKSGFSFLTGDVISEDNWYLWGIGALNLILVIAIIFIAIGLVRKKE